MDHTCTSNAGDDRENITPALLNNKYQSLAVLGEGTFGEVTKCFDHSTQELVAIKCLKGADGYLWGQQEASILDELMKHDPVRFNIILFKDYFLADMKAYLVFEYFEKDLGRFGNEVVFPMRDVRAVASQLIHALYRLEKLGIIHSDIKPSNIMVVGREDTTLRIKLIDFGSAIRSHRCKTIKTDITTLCYRAPEVVVGVPSDESIDMWSAGCVIAGLFLSTKLYPAVDEAELLGTIFASHGGIFPPKFVEGTEFGRYIRHTEQGFEFQSPCLSVCPVANLEDLEKFNEPDHLESDDLIAEKLDRVAFVDFMKEILALDSDYRLTPEQAFFRDFLSMKHFEEYRYSSHVLSSVNCVHTMGRWM